MEAVEFIKNYWYIPILVLILITGIIMTIKLKGIQFTKFPTAIRLIFSKEKESHGEVSTFAALCMSLSATIGTGNIIGVATAIFLGGPGALFWMIILALFGLATKYAEGFLAIKYRHINKKGEVIGGPMAYIEYGMGEKYKPLAKTFAFCAALAALMGIGTMTQSNGISEACGTLFASFQDAQSITLLGKEQNIITVAVGIIITFLAAIVLIGGTKRISKVCELIVPFMAILYIGCCLLILLINITIIPSAFVTILKLAFNVKSLTGALAGYTILKALTNGAQKGIFSNEAGLGSTPIALATAKCKDPVKQGLISMGGMIITIFICLMTGLVVVVTGAYQTGHEGINITNYAFMKGLPFDTTFSTLILLLCVTFFGFTTIIGWNLYGMKSINYLTNGNKLASKIYLVLYLFMVYIGSVAKVDVIWNLADIFNAFMAIPNLIALIALSKVVSKETNEVIARGEKL